MSEEIADARPLEYAATDDLVAELGVRFNRILIVTQDHPPNGTEEGDVMHNFWYRGGHLAAFYLCEYAKASILDRFSKGEIS